MISSDVDTFESVVDLSPAERSWLRDEQVRHARLLAQLKAEFQQLRQQARRETTISKVPAAVVESVVKPSITPTPGPVREKRPPLEDKKPISRKKIEFSTL